MKILGTNDKSDLFLVLFFKLAHFLIPQVVDQFGFGLHIFHFVLATFTIYLAHDLVIGPSNPCSPLRSMLLSWSSSSPPSLSEFAL